MAAAQSNSGDFISILSSEDERPLPKKRRSANDSPASNDEPNASTERSKRARISSASADSATGAKVSEEGEIDEEFESEAHTPDTGSEGKRSGTLHQAPSLFPGSPQSIQPTRYPFNYQCFHSKGRAHGLKGLRNGCSFCMRPTHRKLLSLRLQ